MINAIVTTPLNEQTDTSPLTKTIAVSFTDADLSDVGHTAAITGVARSGETAGLAALTDAQLMALVTPETVIKAAGSSSGSVNLDFSAASTVFDYLATGQIVTLTYTVAINDHDGGVTPQTFVVTITGTNDAPVLDAGKTPVLDAENEGAGAPVGAVGTLVSSLVDLNPPAGGLDNVTDVDNGAVTGIALTGVDTSHGTWFYSIDGGAHWLAVGSVSDSSALLLAADGNTRLYFQPNAGYSGTDTDAITFHAWDQTSGSNGTSGANASVTGGSTAFSNATDTANITINAVDIAPVVDLNAGTNGNDNVVSYTHRSTTSVQIAADATITDVDSADLASMTVTVTNPQDDSAGGGGINIKERLTLNAAAATAAAGLNVTFTSDVANNGDPVTLTITGNASVLTYQTILRGILYTDTKDGNQVATDRLVTVVVNDGTLDSTTHTTTIHFTAPAGAAGEPINLALADPSSDHLGALTVTVSGIPSGWSLSQGSNNGDGTWTLQTNDIAALTVTSPGDYAGALVLDVAMSWTNPDGSLGSSNISDNLEVYAQGAPIFALMGDDVLTASSNNDLLVFSQPIGHDRVYSFDTSADRIDLVGFAGYTTFAAVQAHLSEDASGNAVIAIADGQSITLDGIHAASLTAANFVFDQTPEFNNGGLMTIEDGALLPLSGMVHNSGTIMLNSTGHQTDLQLIQTGLTLQGGGQIVLSDNGESGIFGTSSSVTLDNEDNTISGAGQLGGGELNLINAGTIDATGSHALTIDTGSNIVVNSRVLEASGSGGLVVASSIANSGELWAHGATLTVQGDVSGNGVATIDGGGTLDFEASSTAHVVFGSGASETLKLGDSFHFNGTISGFAGSDVIDLADLASATTSISYQENAAGTGGTLAISDGAHTVELSMLGHYTTDNFSIASNGVSGSLITHHDLVV